MNTYIVTDTDYESPSPQHVIQGPTMDLEAAQADYHKRFKNRSRQDFVSWLCRYKGFTELGFDVFEADDRTPPPKPSKGDREFNRIVGPMMDSVIRQQFELRGEEIERQAKIMDLLKSKKQITFGSGLYVNPAIGDPRHL